MKLPRARWLLVPLVILAVIFAVLASQMSGATPFVRDRVVEALNARFASRVGLESLQVSVFPRPEILGSGLVLRHNGRTDVPPLLQIPSFSASAGLWGLRDRPLHLKTVELDGLDIRIPPGGLNPGSSSNSERYDGMTPPPPLREVPAPPRQAVLLIDLIRSTRSTLEIVPRDPTKLPRIFEIHDLEMRDFSDGAAATFRASLTNPKPAGRIDTEGTFGPWRADEPGLTPITGAFLFANADMNTIKGIGGTLSASGNFNGALERIEVSGQTEVPDFSIDVSGQQVPLKTTFQAVVDGTNGNTWLERVEAVLQETTIVARGAVVRARDVKGRNIAVDVTIDQGRIEDLLKLAVNSPNPPLTGRIGITTKMLIPAGDEDVIDKMQLQGEFELAQARFTDLDVQRQINMLSTRGEGDEVSDGRGPSVVSNLRGQFVMRDAAIRFSSLTFATPGAVVQLAGVYNLRSEAIDFAGNVLFDASLADMTSGFKSVAARIFQPFFRRPGGGSRLPIKITGSRSKPAFGLDVRRAFLPG
jgi:hypothetical protein